MRWLRRHWKPGQHISIIAPTGRGKTYLICRGLLPMLERDRRVMLFDVKGDDSELRMYERCSAFPSRFRRMIALSQQEHYRLVVTGDRSGARNQVDQAMASAYKEGDWVLIFDETRAITDPKSPNLNLGPAVEQLWLRGRSRRVTIVAATQAPRWVPASFYEQARYIYIGRILDRRAAMRLSEIGGHTERIQQAIAQLRLYEFAFVDVVGEGISIVKAGR